MTLGMLLAIPAVAYAAELVVNAELNSTTVTSVTVKQGETANFDLKVSATGNVACGSSHTATVAKDFSLDDTAALSVVDNSAPLIFPSSPGTSTNCPITGGPYTVTGSITADQDTPVGTYPDKIVLSEAQGTTATTDSNTNGGKLDDTTATKITVVVEAGTPTPSDTDGDGVVDEDDNCPDVSNADQADADGDGIGDVCDPTPNGDNVAPEIVSDNVTVTVPEGQTATNTGTWSDANAGDMVDLSASVGNVTKNPDGTWSWSYDTTDGPDENQTVTITADDGTTTSTTSFTLTVNNVAPTTTLSTANPTSVNENSTTEHTYSYTIADPGADTVSSVQTSCDTNGTKVGSDSFTNTGGSFKCKFDDGTKQSTVSAGATDSDSLAGTADTQTVDIANVAPSISGISASVQNALANKNVTFTGSATDVSNADTAAGFSWQWSKDGGAYAEGSNSFSTSFSTCGSHSVSAKATDKDGGTSAAVSSDSVNVYNASFSPPVDAAPFVNTVQKGRVIPVKISVSCNGNIANLSPSIQLLSGDKTDGSETTADEIETYSVSNADSTGVMRAVDGGYIYNLRVPDVANAHYTVRVNPFGGSNASSNMYALLKIRK
jgi:hypothetical protein